MSGAGAAAAETEVARRVRAASSSFYWAMRLMPAERRRAMFALYAFCREVDDIADDPLETAAGKQARLAEWRKRIERLYAAGQADETISRALLPAVDRFRLAREDFLAIIDGMEMDAAGPIVAPDMATLDLYCDRVASAVGRLSVRIFGEAGELGGEIAHHQGRALQLANILRDVPEDLRQGRLYLPRELLKKHGIDWQPPSAVMAQPGFVPLWRELAEIAGRHFRQTHVLLARARADMRPARIMLAVYERNFRRLCALPDAALADPATERRRVGRGEKLLIALRIWLSGPREGKRAV
jgi:phytoene synthase